MDKIMEKITIIFRDVFDNDDLSISPDMSSADIDGWDSLAQINLIVAMEKEFSVKFIIDDILKLQNIGDMANLIEKYRARK